eukprot:scaffold5438_cov105-Skeletonema_dohrnii-CCMP3373.AAC.4
MGSLIGWQDLWMTSILVNGVYFSHCSLMMVSNHEKIIDEFGSHDIFSNLTSSAIDPPPREPTSPGARKWCPTPSGTNLLYVPARPTHTSARPRMTNTSPLRICFHHICIPLMTMPTSSINYS